MNGMHEKKNQHEGLTHCIKLLKTYIILQVFKISVSQTFKQAQQKAQSK